MDSIAIKFHHLSVYRASKLVLSELSGGIRKGSFTGVIGANGSGKTSLLRCLAGLEAAPRGSVLIEGEAPLESLTSTSRSQKIAWLPAETRVPFDYTVGDIVAMGRFPWHQGTPTKVDLEKIALAISKFDLTDLRERSLNSLSNGQQQRVMLARVVAGDAPTLLLDEPTTFLDPKIAHYTMQTLKSLSAAGLTVVAAVNDINLVARYCNEILVLHNQSLLKSGSVRETLNPKLLQTVFGVGSKQIEIGDHLQFLIL